MEAAKGDFMLIDYIDIILKKRKPILIASSIAALISTILFFFVIDPVFLSFGTIKSAESGGSLSGLIGSSAIPDLGDLSEIAGSTTISKELALYETIITSRRCLEETILRYGLMEENDYKYMQDAIKDFRENILVIKKDKVAGTMEIGVYDKDPNKAKEMTDYLIYQLNKINIEMNVQNARDNKLFIEERYNLVNNDLKQVEDSLTEFQNKYGISPDYQIQAALKAEVELEAEIKAEEVKLELLKKILSTDQTEVFAQEDKINALKKQLSEIQNNSFEDSRLNIKGGPQVIMNFLRLKRNVEIQNKIISTLIPLLEKSKIDEKRETPTIVVLDNPFLPERKSKPKRITSIVLFTFVIFSFTSIFYILKEKLSSFFEFIKTRL
ncbi:MAG: hypothetical protein IPG02_00675 [Ignavibacteria bacterium]|jgi:tyrosine-protein kinase Etk/Wzc|nr:hypothetical protein [Ignavibacteria bacterium]MBK6877362.1 hypothetical protein [Ignavibacteria bacterium]MBK9226500.1 hypothetical protein [Ignavibacteria bacterium]